MCWIWRLNVQPTDTPLRHMGWLALALALSYANAFGGAFQFDDYKVIVDNPAVHDWDTWRNTDGQGVFGIRPLLKLSYLLNWWSGWGVLGFHLFNLALHLANTWLVYRLAWHFGATLPDPGKRSVLALGTALLFAVHPANTEAVTYVCGRSVSLMAFFYLAAVAVYAAARLQGHTWRLHGVVPVLFALALAVKETAVTLVLALLVWELALGTGWRAIWQRQWSSWLLLAAGAGYFLLNANFLAQMQNSVTLNSLPGNLATQAAGFAYLMRQWAWPLWLNIDPDHPILPSLVDAVPQLLGLAAMLLVAVLTRRKRPWISFALLWVVAHGMALYLVLPRLDVANDRQLYLAAWPLGMALVAELLMWSGWPWRGLFAVGVLVLMLLTLARNQDYRSEIALWEATVKLSPDKARVHNNLGYAYALAGRSADARREYTTALRLDPNHIKAHYNLERLDWP
ncbi:MAG: hypothetical protein FD135_1716 [Comamonadaceae bacterium]|nr:MAG: hypothetical protein FD135_1716 [Comamonadaceae bacterium]